MRLQIGEQPLRSDSNKWKNYKFAVTAGKDKGKVVEKGREEDLVMFDIASQAEKDFVKLPYHVIRIVPSGDNE